MGIRKKSKKSRLEIVDEGDSREGYDDMLSFTETVMDEHLRQQLNKVLSSGKKMFRRFKDTLSSNELELQRYYAFCEGRNGERVKAWLKDKGFELHIVK